MAAASTSASVPDLVPTVSTSKKRTVLGSSRAPSSTSHDDVFTAPSSSSSRSNGRLQIFVDPTGETPQDEGSTPYPDIGTRKTRVKENVPDAKKVGGTTIKQAGKAKRAASGGSKIAVFRDEDGSTDMPPPPVPGAFKTPAKVTQSGIVPFKDEAPSTPSVAFTPFRDEVSIFSFGYLYHS